MKPRVLAHSEVDVSGEEKEEEVKEEEEAKEEGEKEKEEELRRERGDWNRTRARISRRQSIEEKGSS